MDATGAGGDGDGAGKAVPEAPAEATTPPPAPAAPASASASGAGVGTSGSAEKPVKRMMKTPYQLEVLEKTYAAEQYPSEAVRLELSEKIGLSDRQLQMWFCHRRLKDRKPPSKRQRREEEAALAPVMPPPPVLPTPAIPLASSDLMVGTPGMYDEPLLHPAHSRRGAGRSSAVPRISLPDMGRRYYEPPPLMMAQPVMPPVQLTPSELRAIHSVESQIGEPLREDGPVLGADFDQVPPGAFGAPIEQQKQPVRSYDTNIFSRHDPKLLKASAFLPTMEPPFVPNSFTGKRKSTVGNPPIVQPHVVSRAVHEYQFLPEQPSDTYERASRSHYYDTPVEITNARISSLTSGSQLLHGSEDTAPSYAFQGHTSGSGLLTQTSRSQAFPAVPADHEMTQSNSNLNPVPVEGQFDISQVTAFENPLVSSERRAYHDEDASRVERKRKHNEEAKIAKEVEAHERRIRKELEKQEILNRKREEQRRKEMERLDRERRKEEERLLRERQREEERFQREQRREHERMEKFLQKQSRRAEKQRQKEEMRKEKEAARQKAASDRATARRIAREYMELIEDERLELMELAAQSKGLPSMHLDRDTLQQLDSFRGMLSQFPPQTVRLKVPFSIKPWIGSEDNVGKLLMVWNFLITFADVLGLSPVTLDEFVQSLHDYDSRLLGELHVAMLKSIIKDIEDVARTPAIALGVNPGGGHPQIVEGAYAWGFNIRSWQRHLNLLTWPEILRQFALSAGFGPQLKKRNADDSYYRNDNEGHDGENVISTLRNGSAAVNAAALMKERGYTHRRRSRHRLTPGTVKFAAFHVLSLEGSKGLTILEVAEKIQKSGLRDLTTSKTPEASIAAALSRDTKLFERTAPSTYCVKSPYRKDPADSEAVLTAAREKIRAFQNVLSDSEAEKEADEAERDDDSECDDNDDDDGDDVNTEVEDDKDPLPDVKAQDEAPTTTELGDLKNEADSVGNALNSSSSFTKSAKGVPLPKGKSIAADTGHESPSGASSANHEVTPDNSENTHIDESNQVEPWVRALAEGDYCDLSVEERLNALVALVGVSIEGNSIRGVLEERLEFANALKKQMWAEAQLDKRRSKEEFASRMQYNSYMGLKADIYQENNATENTSTPACNAYKENDGHMGTINNCEILDQYSQGNAGSTSYERNGVGQEMIATPDASSAQQYAYADKTRSQLKLYIGHRAEQLYVYRSLPLGQDRRRNRYWQFTTSASPNDPGSGRIFFESKDGYWRVIDSEEAFDSLVAALDTRGSREAQLHSMLQMIEPTFKEAIKRRDASIELSTGRYPNNGATDMIRATCHSGSSNSTPFSVASDSVTEYSDSFKVELGRNDFEKTAITRRADAFLKWMWRECYNQELTCAMKYGEKRCSELLHSCNFCYQIYLVEERHCSSCHTTFKSFYNFSEHTTQCEEKQRTDPNWKRQIVDYSVPIGMILLKLQLASIEAAVPSEALQPFWTDVYRKSWSVKLYSANSTAEVLQLLTVLEGAIRRDRLSSDFETTSECLNSQDVAPQNPLLPAGCASVLPWVPDTTAAVMVRMLDLDSAVLYTQNQKEERDGGGFMKFPSRYTVAKSKQETTPLQPPTGSDLYGGGRWLPGSGRRGRGRGSRGGSRGGRGRSRGGRVPRGVGSSSRVEFKDDGVASDKVPRKNARRGRARGRGRGRGRRTVRSRQPSEGRARSIPKANLLGSFSMLSSSKPATAEESPRSSGADEWGLETRVPYTEGDENSSGSQSEDNEETGQPMDDDYEEQVPDYSVGYASGSRPHGMMSMMDHESDDEDEDAEGDENVDEDDADHAVDDADIEMDEDDEIGDDGDGDDGGDGGEMNVDEDEDATSYSSDYSE